MNDFASTTSTDSPRRVASRFGLVLLETIRELDAPLEVFEDEDVSVTMPRRLGLSDVVERQIEFHRQEAKRRGRMTDEQARDLMRLVIRRPDAEEIFHLAGRTMANEADDPSPSALQRLMPRPLVFALARRRVRRGLQAIFGRRVGGFSPGPFALEGRQLPFIDADPGGDACYFVTGYCQAVVDSTLGDDSRVVHAQCQSRRDELCRWTITADARSGERAKARSPVREMMGGPEPELG